ncbi:MAG: hypothetical protein WCA89_02835, partial [Terracidiphilus sp.]
DKAEELVDPCFFSASAPSAGAAGAVVSLMTEATAFEHEKMEQAAAPAPPRFAELSEEPALSLIMEASEEEQPDLEKPAFLRRLQF